MIDQKIDEIMRLRYFAEELFRQYKEQRISLEEFKGEMKDLSDTTDFLKDALVCDLMKHMNLNQLIELKIAVNEAISIKERLL